MPAATLKDKNVGQLTYIVKIETDVNQIEVTQASVAGLKTPGMQKVDSVVKFGGHVQDTLTGASDQFQPIKTIMLPLVENLKIFTGLVSGLSEVSATGCHLCR